MGATTSEQNVLRRVKVGLTSELTPMTFPPWVKAQHTGYRGQMMASRVEAARKARPKPWSSPSSRAQARCEDVVEDVAKCGTTEDLSIVAVKREG